MLRYQVYDLNEKSTLNMKYYRYTDTGLMLLKLDDNSVQFLVLVTELFTMQGEEFLDET